jgi:uncharacterized protein
MPAHSMKILGMALLGLAVATAALAVCFIATNRGQRVRTTSPQVPRGWTPLLAAIDRGDRGEVGRLLRGGADPNGASSEGITPLILAVRRGREEILLDLIHAGANPDVRGINGETALIEAMSAHPDSIFDRLLAAHADPNARDLSGNTPLTFLLAFKSPIARVQGLLDRGADPNLRGHDGFSPLELAASRGTPEVIELLLSKGAHFDKIEQQAALREAVYANNVDNVVGLLKRGADPNALGDDGLTVLQHFASAKGRKRSLAALLDAGADPDKPGERGLTARVAAQNTGNDELLELLAERAEQKPNKER